MEHRKIFSFLFLLSALLSSCGTPKSVTYFQDAGASPDTSALALSAIYASEIALRPGDKLDIVVSSAQTPELAVRFNQSPAAVGTNTGSAKAVARLATAPYIIGTEGHVILPLVGAVEVGGLTRAQAADRLQQLLRERQLLGDAVVSVEVINRYVSVLGEVGRAGRVDIDRERLTLLEAIGRSGDLTIKADRTKVFVLRTEGNRLHRYQVDLTETKQLATSPAGVLQPGDVVYVAPNPYRSREDRAYGNVWKQPTIYFSLVSVIASVIALVVAF